MSDRTVDGQREAVTDVPAAIVICAENGSVYIEWAAGANILDYVGMKLYTHPASRRARQVPEPWYPTTYNINRLPNPVRKYIMQLETNADPAGMVRENVLCSEENKMLRALVSEYVDAPGSFARGSAAIRIADMLAAAPSAPEGESK